MSSAAWWSGAGLVRHTHCPGFDPRHCSTWVDKKWDGLQSVFLLEFKANRSSSNIVTFRWKVAYPLDKGASKGNVNCMFLLSSSQDSSVAVGYLRTLLVLIMIWPAPSYWDRISLIYLISFYTIPGHISLNCFSMLDWLFPNCAP